MSSRQAAAARGGGSGGLGFGPAIVSSPSLECFPRRPDQNTPRPPQSAHPTCALRFAPRACRPRASRGLAGERSWRCRPPRRRSSGALRRSHSRPAVALFPAQAWRGVWWQRALRPAGWHRRTAGCCSTPVARCCRLRGR